MTDIRKLLSLIGVGYRKRWLIVIGLAAVVGLLETIGTLIIFGLMGLLTSVGERIDLPVVGDIRTQFPSLSDRSFLLWAAGFAAVFFLVRAVAFVGQSYLQNRAAQNAGVRLSTRLVEGYLVMPYIHFLRRHSSELTTTSIVSVHQIVNFGFIPIVVISSEVLLMLGIVTALFVSSPGGTALAIALVGSLGFLLLKMTQGKMARLGSLHQEMSKDVMQLLQESLQNLRDIRVLGRESFFLNAYRDRRAKQGRVIYLRGVLQEIPRVTTETMLVVAILAFLVLTVKLQGDLDQTIALLGTFGYAGVRVLPALNRVIAQMNNLRFSRAAVDEVHVELENLSRWALEDKGPDDQPELQFQRAIEIKGLTFRYDEGSPNVLQEISLTIPRGSSVGFVGSTGAGKSTLVDIVMGLLRPSSGAVFVDGIAIHDSPRAWQEKLGVVPQTTLLLDDTLKRNIALGTPSPEIHEAGVNDAARLAQLDDFVSTLPNGLDTFVGERGVRLSGGQRQRVAIARALYRNPDVLIFDEATAALDNVTEARLMDAIDQLRGDRTILMVAHRLTTVARCDRIFVLDGGKLVDSGTFEELSQRNSLFRSLAT